MSINRLFGIATAALVLLANLSIDAQAAVITRNFSLGVTADFNVVAAGRRSRAWDLNAQMTPFNLTAGDTVQMNFFFDAPITLQDFGAPSSEVASAHFWNSNTAPAFVSSFQNMSTLFSGASGDFLGNPPPLTGTLPGSSTNSSGVRLESFFLIGSSNLTNSLMTFTELTFTSNYTGISAQTAPFMFGRLILNDDANPVPTPGAFALLGLGLLSFGALRRKSKAASTV